VWNKGKLVGQKAPFKLKEIWAIGVRLEMQGRLREFALFDLSIDSNCALAISRACVRDRRERFSMRLFVDAAFHLQSN